MIKETIKWAVPTLVFCLVLALFFSITSCSWFSGPAVETYNAAETTYSGAMNGAPDVCGPACATLTAEFDTVKNDCMKVTQPVSYPNIAIYKCPPEAKVTPEDKKQKKCLVPCGTGYAWTCFENGVIKLPNYTTYYPDMRKEMVRYIFTQVGWENDVYLDQCAGKE